MHINSSKYPPLFWQQNKTCPHSLVFLLTKDALIELGKQIFLFNKVSFVGNLLLITLNKKVLILGGTCIFHVIKTFHMLASHQIFTHCSVCRFNCVQFRLPSLQNHSSLTSFLILTFCSNPSRKFTIISSHSKPSRCHIKFHFQIPPIHTPILPIVFFVCVEYKKIPGYVFSSGTWPNQVSCQNLIFSPPPIFHSAVPLNQFILLLASTYLNYVNFSSIEINFY